jgi:hypothetical protein
MAMDIQKIIKEEMDGKFNLEDEMGKSIEHHRSQIEHMWRENNIPLNQYHNVYYKVIKIDDYDDPAIYHHLLFVDDEKEGAIEIRGHSGTKKDTNDLIWNVQGGYDNSFFGGGTPHFVGIHSEDLKSEGWTLHPKKVTFPTSKYQNKVSQSIKHLADAGKEQSSMFIKLAITLMGKLEERNNKVKELKGRLRDKDTSVEDNMTKEIESIRNRLTKLKPSNTENFIDLLNKTLDRLPILYRDRKDEFSYGWITQVRAAIQFTLDKEAKHQTHIGHTTLWQLSLMVIRSLDIIKKTLTGQKEYPDDMYEDAREKIEEVKDHLDVNLNTNSINLNP